MAESTVDSVVAAPKRPQAVSWVIAISLAVIAVAMVLRIDRPLLPPAFGQSATQAGARGIFAFSGQLTARTYGLFMVDVDAGTIWCYEYQNSNQKLRLVAGRSWLNDKFLANYQCADPSPQAVEELVEAERALKLRSSGRRSP